MREYEPASDREEEAARAVEEAQSVWFKNQTDENWKALQDAYTTLHAIQEEDDI